MRLHIVGSGCPTASAARYGSAFVLEVGGDSLMFDCGPATTYKMARMGLPVQSVHHVFFTHHHYDHTADFACFALSRWDACIGGEPPLKVYGPPPTEMYVQRLLGEEGAFVDDWKSRVTHPASEACHTARGGALPRPAPVVEAHDVGPGEVASGESWTATAAAVHHVEPTLESLAFRLECDEGSVVFAGDCGDCRALRALARDVDTLVIACTHFGNMNDDLMDVITGTPEVSDIAAQSGARRVVLTHAHPGFARPGMKERAVAEIARVYEGETLFPDELTTVEM